MTVQEPGLSKDQLATMSKYGFSYPDKENVVSVGADLSAGSSLKFSRTVGDLRKEWRMKMTVTLPNLLNVSCLKIVVRYNFEGKTITSESTHSGANSCEGKTGSFSICRNFSPSKQSSTAFFALPENNETVITYVFLNWGLVWSMPNIRDIPVNTIGRVSDPQYSPSVTVTEVRPGICP